MATIPHNWSNSKRVSFGEVRRKLESALLREQNTLLTFVRENAKRIRPEIEDDWLYDMHARYYLACIANHADYDDDDEIHSPFDAAHGFAALFNWYAPRADNEQEIRNRVTVIEVAFKAADRKHQNIIETGFLEHVLEHKGNRPYFTHWSDDTALVTAYTECLKWGEAHTKD